MKLEGKVALITGGTLGIGAAIALDLAKRGANIVAVARNLSDAAQQLQRDIEQLGRKCLLIAGDVTKGDDCTRCVEQTVSEFGRLDVLVHNASGPSPGKIEDITPEQWHETMDLHVNANYYLCRAALPHLRKAGEAAIITVSSTAGIRGVPGAIAYATAKGAIPQFTRSLARDVADDNIRVNCVAPGVIRTRFHDDMPEQRRQLNLAHRIPLHREGTPEQVAEAVAMLITNDYITGETIVIDGGLTSRIC
jgi:NAD(P)-dependent dehydrogenase (short-subunit alcohol dehydrogenase family)